MTKRRGPGQPTKYRPEFCELLIEHMKTGKSLGSFPAEIHIKTGMMVSRPSLDNWIRDIPEFRVAYETGKAHALRFFEMMMRMHITGIMDEKQKKKINIDKGPNVAMCIFALKTRFHKEYGNQLKLQGVEDGAPIKIEDDARPSVIVLPNNNRMLPKPDDDE